MVSGRNVHSEPWNEGNDYLDIYVIDCNGVCFGLPQLAVNAETGHLQFFDGMDYDQMRALELTECLPWFC